jgi:hypothetical protein
MATARREAEIEKAEKNHHCDPINIRDYRSRNRENP